MQISPCVCAFPREKKGIHLFDLYLKIFLIRFEMRSFLSWCENPLRWPDDQQILVMYISSSKIYSDFSD